MKFFRIPFHSDDEGQTEVKPNRLQKYIHAQSTQDLARMASEISPEVRQIIGTNVTALLGYLPSGEFTTTVSASKENLQNLMASAMLTGYFMHAMETRLQMEDLFIEGQPAGDLLQRPETLFASQEQPQPEAREAAYQEEAFHEEAFQLDAEAPAYPDAAFSDSYPDPYPDNFPDNFPDKVFAEPDFSETEFSERFDESYEALYEEESGRFLNPGELEAGTSDQLNIQLEINTRMNRAELARLLRELRDFQDRRESGAEEA